MAGSGARDRPPADQPAQVAVSAPSTLGKGYRAYQRFQVVLAGLGDRPVVQERDLLRGGGVVGVLPVDLVRDEVVLIRQFRLAAHLAMGRGDMIEIVAGRIEAGEREADAARRECREEIGTAPIEWVELFSYLPTPGLTDERVTMFLASVDAGQVPARTGAAGEQEDIRPIRLPIAGALSALEHGTVHSGLTLIALQWLALNRQRLHALVRSR